jgi:MoaA/NifB/PqqE/SkfB family radical SAM enzyme
MRLNPEISKLLSHVRETNIRACIIGFLKYGVGDFIRLEASSICQLKCPLCHPAHGELGIAGRGYLRFNDFKNFVDNYPHFKRIELSNNGEIFLNPELEEIIRYADCKHIRLMANNGVNLNTVSEAVLESLVKYRFKDLTISIDGVTNDTYTIYRKGGNFNTVLENIKRINYYKQIYQIPFPKLRWQFVVFGHNEHELPTARRMAKELNMDFKATLNWDESYSPVRNKDLVRKEIGFASKHEYQQKYKMLYLRLCEQLWLCPQINWDGKLLGCCVNYWGDFGNIFESNLETCLRSEKYRYARKMILGLKKEREDIPCSRCGRYKIMKTTNRYLLPFVTPYD